MSFFPLWTYGPDGIKRKKVTPADATSTVGVDKYGYFTPADVWKVTLEDLGNAYAINSTISYNFISQKKQLNNARVAFLYNVQCAPDVQMVWCQSNVANQGATMVGVRPSIIDGGFFTNHVFRPNYDSITPGGSPGSNATDGLGIWNGIAERPYDMVRLWHLPTARTIANAGSANGLINSQRGTPDHIWWNFSTNGSPLYEIGADRENKNAYGDVFTFKMNDQKEVVGLFSTRVNTVNGKWQRVTQMALPSFNWTLTSFDNLFGGIQQPYNNAWWHEVYTRPATYTLAQAVYDWDVPRFQIEFSVVVLEPSPYMKVYYCLANSQNTEAKMNALVGNFAAVLDLVFPGIGVAAGVSVPDVIEMCILLRWYTAEGKITLTANTLVGTFIANDDSPRNYAKLTSNERELIRTFAQMCVTMPNINLDAPFLRFALNQYTTEPVNLLQTFPEVGCFMPPAFMDTYWRTLRAQLTIPSGLQRPECFFQPCTTNANPVKTAALLRAPGQVVSCGPLISCVNITNTTITNQGQIVGDVSVLNTNSCQAAYTESKEESKNDPGGGGTSGGGGGGSSSGSGGLSEGAIIGIVIGVIVLAIAFGVGLGLAFPPDGKKTTPGATPGSK